MVFLRQHAYERSRADIPSFRTGERAELPGAFKKGNAEG
jgi:hypothetical protein